MVNDFKYYPNYDDNNFYEKLIKKKEFYTNRIPKDRKTEAELCDKNQKFQLLPQQAFLKNYISGDTPYSNILIFHGTGVGKTFSAISIAENFAEMVKKYDGKIYVLVSGNETKINFRNKGLLGGITEEKYITQEERQLLIDLDKMDTPNAREEIKRIQRRIDARIKRQGNYKILGYETFVNRTIGRILKDTKTGKDRKDNEGNLMREIVGTPIINLDNSVLIVDEAHRIINDNDFGGAIKTALLKSKNFRLVLLTATPMFHGPETIIELLNLLHLPKNLNLTIDDIFNKFNPGENEYILKNNALELIRNYSKGYISYSRGKDPNTFPTRIDVGIIPKPANIKEHSKYTKVVRCEMTGLQLNTYLRKFDGTKSKNNIYLSNLVLPSPEDKNIGIYTNDDIQNKLMETSQKWLKENGIQVIDFNEGTIITGEFLKEKNLKQYSAKYYQLLQNIKESYGKSSGPIFIYIEDIVGVGLNMVQQLLIQNGFIEYLSDTQKNYNENTIDTGTGLNYSSFIKKYDEKDFNPCKFISIYGESDMKRRNLLIEKFNSPDNFDGSKIKIILGSRVTRESIDFKNIKQIHILNAQWEFGSLEQIIGRGVRTCSHTGTTGEKRNVYVYKYVSSLPTIKGKYDESIEERLYREQEKVDVLIKQIERVLKENAVDCVLNKNGNVFQEEINEYKDCETSKNKKLCSHMCEYQDCNYKCAYELPKNKDGFYDDLPVKELDKSTYNINFAKMEVNYIKDIILKLYKKSYVYTLEKLLSEIYSSDKNKYLDKQYILYALNEIIENKEIIKDKFDIQGYLIYRGNYYIFQPLNESEGLNLEDRIVPSFDKKKEKRKLDNFIKDLLGKDVLKIKEGKDKETTEELEKKILQYYILLTSEKYSKLPFYTEYFDKNKNKLELYSSYLLGNIPIKLMEKLFRDIILNNKLTELHKWVEKKMKKYFIYKDDIINNASLSLNENLNDKVGYQLIYGKPLIYIEEWKDGIKYINDNAKRRFKELNKLDYTKEANNVGYMAEIKDIVSLKLRPKLDNITLKELVKDGFLDRRKIPNGFICRQSSDKSKIVEIAKELDIDINKKQTISNICLIIELQLRLNKLNEKGNKNWLYDWWEIPN